MVDVNVNFTLEEQEPYNAEFTVNPDVTYTADIRVATGTTDHTQLNNREVADQHPISAITGLQEALETFVFEQGIASNVWVINHNLNKAPSITLVDSSGAEFEAQKVYNDMNTVTIYLNGATTGKAYLN